MKKFSSLIILLFLISSCQNHEDEVRFFIKDKTLSTIDDRLFGQFLEKPSWHGELGPEAALKPGTDELQDGVLQLMKNMNIPVLRFPGGTDVDITDWTVMVDNIPGRPVGRPLFVGHRGDTVSTQFGYDEAGKLAEELNAELMLVVNFGDAYFDRKTPEQAALHEAGLLAYCAADTGVDLPGDLEKWPRLRAENGHPDPYPVRYVQIANEPWVMDRNNLKQRGPIPDFAKEKYFSCLEIYINTFKEVLPAIEIIADGNCEELTAPLKEKFGDRIDYVAYHSYMPWAIKNFLLNGKEISPDSLTIPEIWRAWIAVPGINVQGYSAFMDEGIKIAKESGYPVAVTEWNWNGWWGSDSVDPDKLGSMYTKGVGAAGYIHALMRESKSVVMGIQSMLVGNSWGITAIRVSPEGNHPPYPLPTGQVTGFYSRYHGKQLLEIESDTLLYYSQPFKVNAIQPAENVALIDVLATKSENKLYLHLINRDFSAKQKIVIDIPEFDLSGDLAMMHSLTGNFSNNNPCNTDPLRYACETSKDISLKNNELSLILPPASVNIIEINLR